MNSNDYVSVVSDLSVVMSKSEVTRPNNFHKVLKTSVSVTNAIVFDLTLYYMQRTSFAVCCFY